VHILPVTSSLAVHSKSADHGDGGGGKQKEPRKAREVYRFQDFCF